MPSLKEVRIRITSVKSTQQITSAMKLVSAAKFRKAQQAILKLRPYADKMKDILMNLSANLDNQDGKYSEERELKNVLIVVVSSNKGMCSAFNSNVIKRAVRLIDEEYSGLKSKGNLHLMTIGKKATDFFQKNKYNIIESHDKLFDQLNFDNASVLAEKLMNFYTEKKYDRIVLVYNFMKNAAVQIQICEQFLPVEAPKQDVKSKNTAKADYIFEPNKEVIVQELIPKSLKIQFYKAVLNSNAGEHGARMTAMHLATENASVLLKELQLTYNKARQGAITKELLEIVSGAEALKG